jgi:NADH-quinone oxidoreductase subunit F
MPMADPQQLGFGSDTAFIDSIVASIGATPDKCIPLLQAIQTHFGYLPQAALAYLCSIAQIRPAAVTGVSTFYSQFRHRPAGKHIVKICVGTACHVKGADLVYDSLRRHLGCKAGEDTDAGMLFTLEKVACLGCCTLAPVVKIDSVTYGHVTASSAPRILEDFLGRSPDTETTQNTGVVFAKTEGIVRVGLGSCCMAGGSMQVMNAARKTIDDLGVNVAVKRVGCVGMCHRTPLLEIETKSGKPSLYAQVSAQDVPRIIRRHFKPRGIARGIVTWLSNRAENLLTAESEKTLIHRYAIDPRELPVSAFLDRQKHIASEYCGAIDPTDIEEYRRNGGFEALKRCITKLSADTIIDTVEKAGLRGRGGAGFPTGVKWRRVRENAQEKVYVVCNGDEGDPGAFMDRMLFESYPFRIIEGMAIAARAVGASEGVFYIRAEYPLALKRVREALDKCHKTGCLGVRVLGTDFSLDLRVMEGAGAFVCGEETALLRSIEGLRGMPRFRPPYPAQKGLWGKPTLINNCETYACIPWIIRNGATAFASIGTTHSAGTKIFSLAGKVRFGGLIEVPMGMTIREIVEEIGGGIADDKKFKAVQIGGPSGGCIPERLSGTPIDFQALSAAGAMMGSGGLVVLDEDDCMIDIARYFLSFTQSQSCGRCTFCRIGTRRMLDILEALCAGRAKRDDLEKLEKLACRVADASLCGLGKTAPNPVLSTIRYFREEYEAHLRGECPAKKCKSLIAYTISDTCIGCTICRQNCPVDAIAFTPHTKHEIDQGKCVRCGACRAACPVDAVALETGAKAVSLVNSLQ